MKDTCEKLCKLQYDCLQAFCDECRGSDASVYLSLMSQDASAVFNSTATEELYAEYLFRYRDGIQVVVSTKDIVTVNGFINENLICRYSFKLQDSAMIKRTTKAFWEYMKFNADISGERMSDGNYRFWLFK